MWRLREREYEKKSRFDVKIRNACDLHLASNFAAIVFNSNSIIDTSLWSSFLDSGDQSIRRCDSEIECMPVPPFPVVSNVSNRSNPLPRFVVTLDFKFGSSSRAVANFHFIWITVVFDRTYSIQTHHFRTCPSDLFCRCLARTHTRTQNSQSILNPLALCESGERIEKAKTEFLFAQ